MLVKKSTYLNELSKKDESLNKLESLIIDEKNKVSHLEIENGQLAVEYREAVAKNVLLNKEIEDMKANYKEVIADLEKRLAESVYELGKKESDFKVLISEVKAIVKDITSSNIPQRKEDILKRLEDN